MKTVLILDDDLSLARLLAGMVGLLGHRTEVFTCPDDCLAWLETASPDLALIDLHLPGTDGVTLTERLRREGRGFPVVVITGDPYSEIAEKAVTRGADAVLAKPFGLTALGELLQHRLPDGMLPDPATLH